MQVEEEFEQQFKKFIRTVWALQNPVKVGEDTVLANGMYFPDVTHPMSVHTWLKTVEVMDMNKNVCFVWDTIPLDIDPNTQQVSESFQLQQVSDSKLARCTKPIVIVGLHIEVSGKAVGHENMIIINLWSETVERFEPYGTPKEIAAANVDSYIENSMMMDGGTLEQFKSFKYIPSHQVCVKGPQKWQTMKQEGNIFYGATCALWSMFWALVRIVFPLIESSKIFPILFNYLRTLSPAGDIHDVLYSFIRKFKLWMLNTVEDAKKKQNAKSSYDSLLMTQEYGW